MIEAAFRLASAFGAKSSQIMVLPVRNFILMLLVACAPATAHAGNICDVPVSDWQPLENLRARLAAAGVRIKSIGVERGCYYAEGVDASGHEITAFYDPATLARKTAHAAPHEGGATERPPKAADHSRLCTAIPCFLRSSVQVSMAGAHP